MTAPLRVGLNALFLDPGVSGGTETYLRSLAPALVEGFPGATFELATTRRGAAALRAEGWGKRIEVISLPCDDNRPVQRTLVEQLWLPRLARRRRWDLLHSLANRGPRVAGTTSVVTVHDVIFFHHRSMGLVSTLGMRWAVRGAVAGADGVIAISEAAADDISRMLGVGRERIAAVPHGPGREPGLAAPAEQVRHRYGLDEGTLVVLCVAAMRTHKNQGLLVRALAHLPPEVHLVLAGRDDGYAGEVRAQAAVAGVSDRLHLLDYVPDAELEGLWAIAGCAALPTLAEGFGLPVLEAMRRGVPVACSDLPVMREVAGDCARFFEPNDARAAAEAIRLALGDRESAERVRRHAAAYSWEAAAAATFDFYTTLLASTRSG